MRASTSLVAQAGRQAAGGGRQQAVAHRVAEGVVDGLEVVEVEEQHRQLSWWGRAKARAWLARGWPTGCGWAARSGVVVGEVVDGPPAARRSEMSCRGAAEGLTPSAPRVDLDGNVGRWARCRRVSGRRRSTLVAPPFPRCSARAGFRGRPDGWRRAAGRRRWPGRAGRPGWKQLGRPVGLAGGGWVSSCPAGAIRSRVGRIACLAIRRALASASSGGALGDEALDAPRASAGDEQEGAQQATQQADGDQRPALPARAKGGRARGRS